MVGDLLPVPIEAVSGAIESFQSGNVDRAGYFGQLCSIEDRVMRQVGDYMVGASAYTLGTPAVDAVLQGDSRIMTGELKPAVEVYEAIMEPFTGLPDGMLIGIFPFNDYPASKVRMATVTSLQGAPEGEGQLVVHDVEHNRSEELGLITPYDGWHFDVDLRLNWVDPEWQNVTPRMKIATIACDPVAAKPLIIYPNWSIHEGNVAVGAEAIAAKAEGIFVDEPDRLANVMITLDQLGS